MVSQLRREPSDTINTEPVTTAAVWLWLDEVFDPEIPGISLVDLGIIRNVQFDEIFPEACVVTVTPTYSGCPATEVIGTLIREVLAAHGLRNVDLRVQLAPAWTTDWITDRGRINMQAYGIAPPMGRAEANHLGAAQGLLVLSQDLLASRPPPLPACPRCGSPHTERLSQFGSTPCKSLHRCLACLEPFEYFKCH